MTAVATTSVVRTFSRVKPAYMPGLGSDSDEVDVTVFDSHQRRPIRFRAEGKPATDDFHLAHDTWQTLGHPDRIQVTVEAA